MREELKALIAKYEEMATQMFVIAEADDPFCLADREEIVSLYARHDTLMNVIEDLEKILVK